ncbi:MAG: thermonuclease family protein [Pseudomonadota bacterium]
MKLMAWACAALFLGSSHLRANTLLGKVVAVLDGDTITVLHDRQETRVRIVGIDAPEKRQAFGQRSKQSMSDCAFGKEIEIEWKKLDRYGRTVGKVLSGDVDCGLRQIELGMAWHYKAYAKDQARADREAYATVEDEAKADRRGLWSDANPTPPWDLRHPKNAVIQPCCGKRVTPATD